jgi:saccharopine dehydrogenase-like NADP-dependent oxidoreductase
MSGYKNFAVVGAGNTGSFIIHQLLKDKSAGTVNEVVVLTRQVSLVLDIESNIANSSAMVGIQDHR